MPPKMMLPRATPTADKGTSTAGPSTRRTSRQLAPPSTAAPSSAKPQPTGLRTSPPQGPSAAVRHILALRAAELASPPNPNRGPDNADEATANLSKSRVAKRPAPPSPPKPKPSKAIVPYGGVRRSTRLQNAPPAAMKQALALMAAESRAAPIPISSSSSGSDTSGTTDTIANRGVDKPATPSIATTGAESDSTDLNFQLGVSISSAIFGSSPQQSEDTHSDFGPTQSDPSDSDDDFHLARRRHRAPLPTKTDRTQHTESDSARQKRGDFLLISPLSTGSDGSSFNAGGTPESSKESLADSAVDGERMEFHKFPVHLTSSLHARLEQFEDDTIMQKFALRQGKEYRSGQVIDFPSLELLGVRAQFETYFDNVGFGWLLNIPVHSIPTVVANEFFNSFKFTACALLDDMSVSFRLFGTNYEMSLLEWNVRLGIVSEHEALESAFQSSLCGIPTKISLPFDPQHAWHELTHPAAGQFKATQSRAFHFTDPVLRMCQVYLGYNLFGQTTGYSKLSLNEFFIVWCMHTKVKLNLGFWIAFQINLISSHPNRNLTLCHFLAIFIARNIDLVVASNLSALPMSPPPAIFDLHFLKGTGIVHNFYGDTRFYTPGETIHPAYSFAGTIPPPPRESNVEDRLKVVETALTDVRGEVTSLRQSIESFLADLREAAGSSIPSPAAPTPAPPDAGPSRPRRAR